MTVLRSNIDVSFPGSVARLDPTSLPYPALWIVSVVSDESGWAVEVGSASSSQSSPPRRELGAGYRPQRLVPSVPSNLREEHEPVRAAGRAGDGPDLRSVRADGVSG